MNITYRREIKHNYMIIDPETLAWDGYEIRILEHNQIDGLLGLKLRQTAEGVRFYYDITSRQPLSRLLQGQKWKAEQIRELMREIFGILERMEHYLLSENDIYLDPDYIYMDPEDQKVWLCIIPGLSEDFTEALRKLLEKILEHIDHQDRDTVMLAYGLHHQSCKPNFGMDDILKLIYRKTSFPLSREKRRKNQPRSIETRMAEDPEIVHPGTERTETE